MYYTTSRQSLQKITLTQDTVRGEEKQTEIGSYEETMLSHSNTGPSLLHMLLQVRALAILITIQPQDTMHLIQTTDTHIPASPVFGFLTVTWARVFTTGVRSVC